MDLESGFRALARPGGGFAMLAMDQRVSLENIFVDAGLEPTEAALDAFRDSAVSALAPNASAVLLDARYVSRAPSPPPWRSDGGLIVAAEHLEQASGQPASDSTLDHGAASIAVAHGAAALKFLVIWDPGRQNDGRVQIVRDFVALAHEHGMVAVVEVIVIGDSSAGRDRATPKELLAAAALLSGDADIYKGQVPFHAGETPADVERLSLEMTATVPGPWVVLSTGVPPERFGELMAASCRGGASGFLAGRAIWRPAIGQPDPAAHLAGEATDNIVALAAIVDAEARPWSEATAAGHSSDSADR
jgi:sulfofructosephosphate aldolase